MRTVTIAGIPIGDGHPCRLVAEIGTNASGSAKVAKEMIRMAKEAGCDFVKFQARTPRLAVPEAEWNDLRDTPWGKMTKLEYREAAEFNEDGYRHLFAHARSIGIVPFASVWDIPALERMERVGSPCHKIPSARAHDEELLKAVAQTGKPVILSTGMSDMNGVRWAVYTMWNIDLHDGLIILHCTSSYPARADESNLRVIQEYRREFITCPIGFSSHKIGQLTVLLAVAAGANMIERHLTTDRGLKGSDHRLSTEPAELARLVREVRQVEAILGDGTKRILESELPEAKRLGRVL